jgi:hypothetical protein
LKQKEKLNKNYPCIPQEAEIHEIQTSAQQKTIFEQANELENLKAEIELY